MKLTEGCFVSIGDVEEAIVVLAFLVDISHQCVSFEHVLAVHKEVERVLLWQLDALSDDVVEVVGREIIRHKVLRLVNVWELGSGRLLTYHRNPVRVAFSDSVSFLFASLYRMR